jgi:hypothetical protein
MMTIRTLLSYDHERLDALLEASVRDGVVDETPFSEFRSGLLRHIGIEERLLFPEMRKHRGAQDLEVRLHRDHAALAALLVPPPTAEGIAQVRAILVEHNPLEELPGGLYDIVDATAADELITRVREFPQIPVMPYSDTPILRRSIEQLLRERRAVSAKEDCRSCAE